MMEDNTKQDPLVSVGVPVYNVEPFIEKCLLSVLNQSYRNIEIVTVDDCGNDKSMEIVYDLQKNHPRGNCIKVIKHQKQLKSWQKRLKGIIQMQFYHLPDV